MAIVATRDFPEHFVQLKERLVESIPNGEQRLTTAWEEVLTELKMTSQAIKDGGSDVSPDQLPSSFLLLLLTIMLVYSPGGFLRVELLGS